jgi:anti-anti-sigma regulatory factor
MKTHFEYRPGEFEALLAEVRQSIAAGFQRVVLDLDAMPRLDAASARDLILLLRRTREIGGNVALHTTRADLTSGLEAMALDRLFEVNAA